MHSIASYRIASSWPLILIAIRRLHDGDAHTTKGMSFKYFYTLYFLCNIYIDDL